MDMEIAANKFKFHFNKMLTLIWRISQTYYIGLPLMFLFHIDNRFPKERRQYENCTESGLGELFLAPVMFYWSGVPAIF